jgi:hypothetical protein
VPRPEPLCGAAPTSPLGTLSPRPARAQPVVRRTDGHDPCRPKPNVPPRVDGCSRTTVSRPRQRRCGSAARRIDPTARAVVTSTPGGSDGQRGCVTCRSTCFACSGGAFPSGLRQRGCKVIALAVRLPALAARTTAVRTLVHASPRRPVLNLAGQMRPVQLRRVGVAAASRSVRTGLFARPECPGAADPGRLSRR